MPGRVFDKEKVELAENHLRKRLRLLTGELIGSTDPTLVVRRALERIVGLEWPPRYDLTIQWPPIIVLRRPEVLGTETDLVLREEYPEDIFWAETYLLTGGADLLQTAVEELSNHYRLVWTDEVYTTILVWPTLDELVRSIDPTYPNILSELAAYRVKEVWEEEIYEAA